MPLNASESRAMAHPLSIPLLRLRPDALLPQYQTEHAAGMDLFACLTAPVVLPPMGRALIPTGWALALPVGYEAQVRPRSGLALKHGITVLNSPGTIDADYRGELQVLLINLGDAAFEIIPQSRIAQLVIAPVPAVVWAEVTELPSTQRGTSGFGHTGV